MERTSPTTDQLDRWSEIYRAMINNENELQNQRLTWYLTIQGFFLGALAFAWDKADAWLLIFLFCGLGIIVSLMFGEGMRVSKEAQQGLKKEWDAYRSLVPAYHGPDIVAYRSPANSVAKHMRPWRSLPAVFMIAWGLIGLLNFLRF